MPGIIVSRPIFNTLFKLAHDEGLSINAFLTKLLEKAGPEAVAQAAGLAGAGEGQGTVTPFPSARPAREVATAEDGSSDRPAAGVEIIGSERMAGELDERARVPAAAVPAARYDNGDTDRSSLSREPEDAPGRPSQPGQPDSARGRRIGNSIWDKVVSMEGHRFATSRGKKFSYKVTGEYIVVRDSSARIPRSQFDKAEKMWPVSGPSHLVGVYAPSVVWAVMKEAAESEAAMA